MERIYSGRIYGIGLSEINLLYTVIAGPVKLAKGSFQTFLLFLDPYISSFLRGGSKRP